MTDYRVLRKRVLVIGCAVGALVLAAVAALPHLKSAPAFDCSGGRWEWCARVQTGHQRAERLVFSEAGDLVAVTCPRYDRLVTYRLTPDDRFVCVADCKLPGKPVSVLAVGDELWVLQRPSGDARHLGPGFWQRYDFDGRARENPHELGVDPDDFVYLSDEGLLLVLLSGNAEGETTPLGPELLVLDVSDRARPTVTGRVELPISSNDDPVRIVLSGRRTHAGIVTYSGQVLAVDLTTPRDPVLTGSVSVAGRAQPRLSLSEDDWIVLPAAAIREVLPIGRATNSAVPAGLLWVEESDGAVAFGDLSRMDHAGKLNLPGPGGIGSVRGVGLGVSPQQHRIAVSDRSGGVHLFRYKPAAGTNTNFALTSLESDRVGR